MSEKDRTHKTPPSLIRRLGIHSLLMMAAVLFCSMSAVLGLRGLNQDFSTADDTHLELRYIYETGYELSRLREMTQTENPFAMSPRLTTAFQRAISSAERLKERPEFLREEEVRTLLESIDRLKTDWSLGTEAFENKQLERQAQINGILGQIAKLSQTIGQRLDTTRESARQRYIQTVWIIISLALITSLLTVILTLRFRQRVSTPISQLTLAAQQYQLETRQQAVKRHVFIDPETWEGDRYLEFDQLARQLNDMAGELSHLYATLEKKVQIQSRQIITQERLASLGQLAAGIAHEINNPLAIIANYGQVLERDLKDSDQAEDRSKQAVSIIVEEAFRCKALTDKLLSLARKQTQDHGRCQLITTLSHIEKLSRGLAGADQRQIAFVNPADEAEVLIAVHEADLIQILLNLISNAIDATIADGQIRIYRSVQNKTVTIEVSDDGIGMTDDQLDQIFEPFYSKRHEKQQRDLQTESGGGEISKGVGLGLSITHALIEKNHGKITVSSQQGQGATFRIELPIANDKDG